MSERVQGYCPACGGASLFLGSGGHVTCSRSDCPNPTAMADVMASTLGPDHEVTISADAFAVMHPLGERLGPALFDCDVHKRLAAAGGPPIAPGRYRFRTFDGAWHRVATSVVQPLVETDIEAVEVERVPE